MWYPPSPKNGMGIEQISYFNASTFLLIRALADTPAEWSIRVIFCRPEEDEEEEEI